MKSRNFAYFCKNAMGTVFLLAGAFFVCSTLVSIRSVFADPIAPITTSVAAMGPQATRAGTASPRSTATTSRRNATNTVSRGTATATTVATSPRAITSRGTASRGTVSRATVTPTASRATTTASRGATATTSRPSVTASRGTTATTATTSRGTATAGRNVVSRGTVANASRSTSTARNVVSRSGTPSRISLQGSAIRGSKAAVNSNTYTYLQNRLYTGNYSNIIDSTTGLISADAYNNCMESYYACMDEICTARNAAQRRCACAGRVRAFAEAESQLEKANEELIEVSGQLALLIATKGKDVSQAFQLTDAEQVMNCVSWKSVVNEYGESSDEAIEWCNNHGIFGSNGSALTSCSRPSYCSESGNTFGFNVDDIDGDGSDILAQLQSWAKAKENTLTILTEDNDSLTSALDELTNVVGSLAGIDGALAASDTISDSLAETWGYDLFEYAHNNVCNRVLDSCFNGIYEACGTPPSGGRKCGNGQSQCPFNYNSYISVSNTDGYNLEFIEPNTGYTASNSATCFGYTSASGDPYADLRGPVADARRSIMQKYALDANADCDLYGEQLSTTAQNIGYQKVAAQQALQQKRLEFYQEEQDTIASDYVAARDNFNECLAELYDCYTTQSQSQTSWSTSRIKTYCAQVSNVPHCYEEMICGAPNNTLEAVIDKDDDITQACNNSADYETNTCRNVVTLSEILDGSYASGAVENSSADLREACMQRIQIDGVRTWTKNNVSNDGWNDSECPAGTFNDNGVCKPNTISGADVAEECKKQFGQFADVCQQTWDGGNGYGPLVLVSCQSGYVAENGRCVECDASTHHTENGVCVLNTRNCTINNQYVASAQQEWSNNKWGDCRVTACVSGYIMWAQQNTCMAAKRDCRASIENAASAYETWNTGTNTYGTCTLETCQSGFEKQGNQCVEITQPGTDDESGTE